MNDPGLNNLLKWSIQNSDASRTDPNAPKDSDQELDVDALKSVFGKSDAQLMQENMAVVVDPEQNLSLEDKVQAFDNFEQLVESIDNANNMEPMGLWSPLVDQLQNSEEDMRFYAAWCCAVAVQNNVRSQERLLKMGAIPTLSKLATEDSSQKVRKKAILALSSIVRNFQPGLDVTIESMPDRFKPKGKLDATDMDSVDSLIQELRKNV